MDTLAWILVIEALLYLIVVVRWGKDAIIEYREECVGRDQVLTFEFVVLCAMMVVSIVFIILDIVTAFMANGTWVMYSAKGLWIIVYVLISTAGLVSAFYLETRSTAKDQKIHKPWDSAS